MDLLDNIESIHSDGMLRLSESDMHSVAKYRKIIAEMQGFYSALKDSREKKTRFPHAKLRRLLKECGFN